jgi:hypothetical protein
VNPAPFRGLLFGALAPFRFHLSSSGLHRDSHLFFRAHSPRGLTRLLLACSLGTRPQVFDFTIIRQHIFSPAGH